MAGFPGSGLKEDTHTEEETEIDDILVSLEEAMERLEESFERAYGDEEDSDDEEEPDAEERGYVGLSLSEKVKKHQREFRKYIEVIRKDLREMGYGTQEGAKAAKDGEYAGKKADERQRAPEAEKDPWERGHKWGCGCPGCTRFRENFLEKEAMDFSIPDGRSALLRTKDTSAYKSEHKDDSSEYPCGGKLRGMFRNGFMKYALADMDKNPAVMNYLAV